MMKKERLVADMPQCEIRYPRKAKEVLRIIKAADRDGTLLEAIW